LQRIFRYMADRDLDAIAREISKQVASLRAARRAAVRRPHVGGPGKGYRHRPPVSDHDPVAFIKSGGLEYAERIAASKAAAEAAREAVRWERKRWLPLLEDWLAVEPKGFVRGILAAEVKRLRRRLGIKPSAAIVREQTRDRVRRFRERQKASRI
jgi:hypothetical protein